jgi:hypothetical protein
MKKKVLLFLVIAATLLGGGYALTQALFSDTETSASNTIAAGTLDMTVDGANGTAFDSLSVENVGATGTDEGLKEWTVRNAGTVPGNLTFSMSSISNTENGCNEPELVTEPNCAADANGELGAATAVVVQVDSNNDGDYADANETVVNSTLASANQGAFATGWGTNAGTVTIPAGETRKVKMSWSNDPQAYGNEIQSDQLAFQVQFNLTQVTP